MSEDRPLGPSDAVLVVDLQRDFCRGGALAVPDGDAIVPLVEEWVSCARAGHAPVYASRDWHPPEHVSFEGQGGPWPPHCVQGSDGAEFHPDFHPPDDVIPVIKGTRFDKDQYSAFDDTGLQDDMRRRGIERVWVMGLAQEVCVKASVLAAVDAGFETHLVLDATRPIDEKSGREAVDEMRSAGAFVEAGPP